MRPPKIPRGARHLRTFAEYDSYLADFALGRYPFIWVLGRPGISKTESIQAAVRGRQVYVRKGGQLTPLQFYLDCYHHRGQPIVLDDAEHLLDNALGARLVSALADTSPVKQMSYGTTSRALGDVPPLYHTTSPLCILANRVTSNEAIRSRAVLVFFDPTNGEIHRAAAKWYWDQGIHDWMGQHVNRLRPIDARWYVIAHHDKQAGRDWRNLILQAHTLDRPSCLVQDLENDPAYPSREAKAARFEDLLAGARGASRATYFRLRRRLEADGRLAVTTIAAIPLRRTRPPAPPTELELDALAAGPPPEAEEPAHPIDVPVREEFVEPVRGQPPQPPPAPRVTLTDRLPWEGPEEPEEPEDGEE
jgi:hypothetical protein